MKFSKSVLFFGWLILFSVFLIAQEVEQTQDEQVQEVDQDSDVAPEETPEVASDKPEPSSTPVADVVPGAATADTTQEETAQEGETETEEPTDEPPAADEEQKTAEQEEPAAQEPSEEPTEEKKEEPTDQEKEEPSEEPAEEKEEPAAEVQETVQEEPQTLPDEIAGIDTVDLEDPQGNWLFKRVWWERSESKYEKIRAAVTKIMEQRAGFFAKRSELDKNVLDPFYIKAGFNRGELNEILSNLISQLEAKQEDEKLEKVQENKKSLQDLKDEVEKVTTQDQEVDSALMQLVDLINRLRNYEQQAWQHFKDIARVLDDKKARELFYKVDNAWRNVQEVQQYINQKFGPSFDQLIAQLQKQTDKTQNSIQTLLDKGIQLKQEITKAELDEPEDETSEEVKPEGILQRFIVQPISYLFSLVKKLLTTVISIIRWPFDKLLGKTTPETAPEMEDEEEVLISDDAVEEDESEQPSAPEPTQEAEQPEPVQVEEPEQKPTEPEAEKEELETTPEQEPATEPEETQEDQKPEEAAVEETDQEEPTPEEPSEEPESTEPEADQESETPIEKITEEIETEEPVIDQLATEIEMVEEEPGA